MREALEGRPERQRTRREYERVMDAYRAVYHSNPASRYADASVSAVADLLAEEGRVFQDDKELYAAIAQYEFLRARYPQSHYRYSALLTIGEVYLRDLNDPESARSTFEQFLRLYPQSPLVAEARIELRNLRHAPHAGHGTTEIARSEVHAPVDAAPKLSAHSSGHRTISQTAIPPQQQSQEQGIEEHSLPAASAESSPTVRPEPSSYEPPHVSEADLNAPPPPRKNRLPLVTGIRYWSTPIYTRVAIDLEGEVRYEAVRVPNPDRIFFDLYGTRLSPVLIGKSDQVIDDGFLRQIRATQFSKDVTRIVLNVSDVSDYSVFILPNPPRLIIDVHGSQRAKQVDNANHVGLKGSPNAHTGKGAAAPEAATTIGLGPDMVAANRLAAAPSRSMNEQAKQAVATPDPDTLDDVASLSKQPDRVRATRRPTTAPVAQSVAGTSPAPQPNELASLDTGSAFASPAAKSRSMQSHNQVQPREAAEIPTAQPTAGGEPTLVRTLGLKINRIVIDAGHGGHDSGTLGPGGIEEKNVVLDVALRLGALLKQRLGADVIYTRDDDTFIPLETRTAIANQAQADLFISIHANSSSDPTVRGVEVYYLNFTTSADALEVAARENAVSDQSIHQLSELVRKIALQDKINESREFAADVDQSLYAGLEAGNPDLKDRGVKKAPFVVLIGANMPSILAEISFLTNPETANDLRQPQYRERIAEALYRGVAHYVDSLNGVRLAEASPHSTR